MRYVPFATSMLGLVLWLADNEPLSRVSAQQPSDAAEPLEILHVQGNVHMIAGDGGNITVQVGLDGAVLVDAGAGRRSADVVAGVRELTDQPIRFILNTSGHADHVGGNGGIAAAGQELGGGGGRGGGVGVVGGVRTGAARVAHENVLLYMARPGPNGMSRFPEAAWPTEGFVAKKNIYLNGEAIQMIHVPAAYSNGDSVVFFRRSDVIATGAIVDANGFPRVDLEAGGSIQGVMAALNHLVDLSIPPTPLAYQKGGTHIVPGWGRIMDQPDVVAYRDMVTIVRDVVQSMIRKGMTLEQIHGAQPTRGYTRRYGSDTGPWTTTMFVDAVYASLIEESRR